jgi:hypothetical protein
MRSSRRRFIHSAAISLAFLWLFSFFILAHVAGQVPAESPQLAAGWTTAVRSLAEKIAAGVSAPSTLAMNWTNASSLGQTEATALFQNAAVELRARQFKLTGPELVGGLDTRVQITFSEDAESYIVVAEIWPAGSVQREVEIASAPKLKREAPTRDVTPTILMNRKLVWEQATKILDFILTPAPGTGLAILESERLSFYRADVPGWRLDRSIALHHAGNWREMWGIIDPNSMGVILWQANCNGDVLRLDELRCEPLRNDTVTDYGTTATGTVYDVNGPPSDAIQGFRPCPGAASLDLVTGNGDWTQADYLRATRPGGTLAQIDFAGPIVVLRGNSDGKSVRVVSRNLQTGMYEASIVSIACAN